MPENEPDSAAHPEPIPPDEASLLICCDGYLAVSSDGVEASQALRAIFGTERLPTRAEAATLLAAPGRIVESVRTVPEVLIDSMTRDRALLVTGHTRSGAPWTLLGSPLRLTRTPPVIARRLPPPTGCCVAGRRWAVAKASVAACRARCSCYSATATWLPPI